MQTETCWVIAGPTASGKTALSLRLAQKHKCEIICMDSMQIYRRMDIGTAKPTAEEQQIAPHHMIDIADPGETFSVARYQEMAEATAADILARGKQPLFVGGTGFYLRALRHPMAMGAVAGDQTIRDELQQIADSEGGAERLHHQLMQIDPVTAERLPVGDVRRIIRALQVYRLTGLPFSQQPQEEKPPRFRYRVACLDMDRALLYERIHQRVDLMMNAGLLDEIQDLLASGVPENCQALKAIGYKELLPVLHGEQSLEEAVDLLKQNTRHYAKRQLTWMRREEDVLWINPLLPDAYAQLETYFLTD